MWFSGLLGDVRDGGGAGTLGNCDRVLQKLRVPVSHGWLLGGAVRDFGESDFGSWGRLPRIWGGRGVSDSGPSLLACA